MGTGSRGEGGGGDGGLDTEGTEGVASFTGDFLVGEGTNSSSLPSCPGHVESSFSSLSNLAKVLFEGMSSGPNLVK